MYGNKKMPKGKKMDMKKADMKKKPMAKMKKMGKKK